MMLSLSAKTTETAIDLQMVNGSSAGDAQGVPYADELASFAEAIAQRDTAKIECTRNHLAEVAGDVVMVDAAAVAANFQRMTRIADATGIPLDKPLVMATASLAADLGINGYTTAQNTPSLNPLERVASRLMAPLVPTMMKLFQPRE